MMSMLPITRPLSIARDLGAADIRDVDFSLFDLFAACAAAGQQRVQGKTITGCRIQGPAVMLALPGVTFEDVNFGDSRGDIRNLLFRPDGDAFVGSIPFDDCSFVGCEFYGVGFTGPEPFLDQMRAITRAPGPDA